MFLKLRCEVVVCRKVSKTVAEYLLGDFYWVSNYYYEIAHTLCPRCKATASIDDYVLEGFEFSLDPFVCAKGSLIIYIVFELVVSEYGLYYLVAVVDGFLEDSFDVFVEIVEA